MPPYASPLRTSGSRFRFALNSQTHVNGSLRAELCRLTTRDAGRGHVGRRTSLLPETGAERHAHLFGWCLIRPKHHTISHLRNDIILTLLLVSFRLAGQTAARDGGPAPCRGRALRRSQDGRSMDGALFGAVGPREGARMNDGSE